MARRFNYNAIVGILVIVLCLPFLFASCTAMQLGGEEDSELLKQKKAYMAARKEFALTLQKYND